MVHPRLASTWAAVKAWTQSTGQVVGASLKKFFLTYEGARNQPSRSWIPGSLQSAKLDYTPPVRRELQRKARYWERNTALVQRLVYLFEEYTVGVGIGFYPASSDPEWNQRARAYWMAAEL